MLRAVSATSALTGGAPDASGNVTVAFGILDIGPGSFGHAAAAAGATLAGATLDVGFTQRASLEEGIASALLVRGTTGAVVALASGAGSGGVRLHALAAIDRPTASTLHKRKWHRVRARGGESLDAVPPTYNASFVPTVTI